MAFADAQKACAVLSVAMRAKITLAGTVTKGDVLGYSSGWKRALATVGGVIQGRLVALQDGVSGDIIEAAPAAVLAGDRFSGATPGARIYVAESTDAGKYTETAPSTQNDANVAIGVVIDATTILVHPAFRGPDTLAP